MTKIDLKIALMFVFALVFYIGVSCADSLVDNGHWLVMACMTLAPFVLFAVACNKGWLEDVMQWSESLEKKLSDC